MNLIVFTVFTFLLLTSSILVVCVKNPIHSVIFLVITFINSAAILILLELEFLAMVLVVVYVGAIAVLFLFVVMMLNVKIEENEESVLNYLPIGLLLVLILGIELSLLIYKNINEAYFMNYINWVHNMYAVSNTQALGMLLYTYYFYLFIVSGIVLLVAMIGAIVLTQFQYISNKRQVIFDQVNKNMFLSISLKNLHCRK
jgi:NADH-quinone oxidoreductase subunit J